MRLKHTTYFKNMDPKSPKFGRVEQYGEPDIFESGWVSLQEFQDARKQSLAFKGDKGRLIPTGIVYEDCRVSCGREDILQEQKGEPYNYWHCSHPWGQQIIRKVELI